MLQTQRKEEIIKLLKENKEYRIDKLCEYFGISLSSIHRDLNELKREGRIKKLHGIILPNIIKDIETKNEIRLRTNIDLKKRITQKALEFVENDDCIFIDNSTTCYYFAEALSESNFRNLVIVTNSCIVPELFVNNEFIQVVSTGGLLLKELNCYVGPCAIDAINKFNGNKFFFSVAAISIKGELSDIYKPDADAVKREMLKKSENHICLIDSSKFNNTGQSIVFSLSEVDKLITDNDCDAQTREELISNGVELIIA
ncbi:MAG: DeoR/GlpR family DNA-binding transcription regulator [Actinobacteria bacterium]|nr:DeoR/GlpR family DNA-binding transcription regulator [Actinomycetota bacterium]